MLSRALIIGDPRRRGKNRPPVFLHPSSAGMELLDLFNNRHLCQTLYMSLDWTRLSSRDTSHASI
jgi:hypothetical protein